MEYINPNKGKMIYIETYDKNGKKIKGDIAYTTNPNIEENTVFKKNIDSNGYLQKGTKYDTFFNESDMQFTDIIPELGTVSSLGESSVINLSPSMQVETLRPKEFEQIGSVSYGERQERLTTRGQKEPIKTTKKKEISGGKETIEESLSELPEVYKQMRIAAMTKKGEKVDVGKLKGKQRGIEGALAKFTEGFLQGAAQNMSDEAAQRDAIREFDTKILPELERTYGTKFQKHGTDVEKGKAIAELAKEKYGTGLGGLLGHTLGTTVLAPFNQDYVNAVKSIEQPQFASATALSPDEENYVQRLALQAKQQIEINKLTQAEALQNTLIKMRENANLSANKQNAMTARLIEVLTQLPKK